MVDGPSAWRAAMIENAPSVKTTISMLAIAFDGLGVPYVLAGGMWLLALLGSVTVIQRLIIVKKALA